MADVRKMRIFAAEQIEVPDNFPGILKNFVKEVVRNQPENQVEFCRQYFEKLHLEKHKIGAEDRQRIEMNPKEFYLSHQDNIKDHYQFHETIGEGALSRVRRGVHLNSGITRAIKVVKKEDLEFGDRRKLLEEIELLKELDHINIGQVYEMYEDKKKLYFVNEMCQGGSLYDRVTQDKGFNEIKVANIMA
jgi:calcium-dependent protein kinase